VQWGAGSFIMRECREATGDKVTERTQEQRNGLRQKHGTRNKQNSKKI
jgi:hypothetical protein